MNITIEQLAEMLRQLVRIQKKCKALDRLMPDAFSQYIEREMSALQDLYLDLCGIPKSGSMPEGVNVNLEFGFSRDLWDIQIYSLEPDSDFVHFTKHMIESAQRFKG